VTGDENLRIESNINSINNATFMNPNLSTLYGTRGYATRHSSLSDGTYFTIIDIDGVVMYCEDWEVDFDSSVNQLRSTVNLLGR
jgi:hypothetical protein